MMLLRWLGSWGGWSIMMLLAMSIHLSGHVAYQAGARSAEATARQTPPQLFTMALLKVLEQTERNQGGLHGKRTR